MTQSGHRACFFVAMHSACANSVGSKVAPWRSSITVIDGMTRHMSASTGSGHRVTTAYSRDVAKPEIEVPFKGTGIGITLVSLLGAHHGRSAPKIPATSQGLSKAPAFSRVATAQT